MSADNWTTCPRCQRRRDTAVLAEERRVEALYGNVPVATWEQARADLANLRAPLPQTWREDYEFCDAETGMLHIAYSGSCRECGLQHTVDLYELIDPAEGPQ